MVTDTQERPATNSADDQPASAATPYSQLAAELREYLVYYAAVRLDQARHLVRRTLLVLVLAAVMFVIAGSLVVTAAVLTMTGIAAGLGEALGGRLWLGNLLTGVTVLLAMGAGAWVASHYMNRVWLNQVKQKYATRRDKQRRQFGRDISGRG